MIEIYEVYHEITNKVAFCCTTEEDAKKQAESMHSHTWGAIELYDGSEEVLL